MVHLHAMPATQFLPHGSGYLWNHNLIRLHVLSDAGTALAYFAISIELAYFARNRRDLPFKWIFWMLAVFIFGCGTTHLLDVWTVLYPAYWLSGGVKAVTAIASIATAVALIWLIPRALALEGENLRRLHEASRLKSEFLVNLSHELRTPLNTVMGFASFIQSAKAGPVTDAQKEYLGDILTSSRHLLQLIDDILDLAKIEAGKMKFHLKQVEIAPLVGEVCDSMRMLAAEKNIALTFEVDSSMPTATLDRAKLKQVLYNYLSNAIKFTPGNGSVKVRVSPERGERFRIEVEDTGIGIAAEDLPHLFADFQQLEAGSAKKYQGTGLGLSLTMRIVEAQGGMVGVKSTPVVGSIFWAILPRVVIDSSPQPIKPLSVGLGEPGPEVLVIETAPR